ncbi:MAG: hypothetical protein HY423_15910 [Candidatus Lambdaproteobacteria bacterium]|nr:hypothetical protein [Candidatus Lambdaproteobacteria bacterium]
MRREAPARRSTRPSPWAGTLARALTLALLAGGCLPAAADYRLGVATTEIVGTFDVSGLDPGLGSPIIVVLKYHYKFETPETGERVTHPSAHLARLLADGGFAISMPADVVSVAVLFIAPDRLTDEFRFRRQIGIGHVGYRARGKPMPDWRDHFYTYLQPLLQELVVEPRYQLSPAEIGTLSTWLEAQRERLERKRATSPRGHTGGGEPLVPPAAAPPPAVPPR